MIALGVTAAAIGFAGRTIMRRAPHMATKLNESLKSFPKFDEGLTGVRYYKGGFEHKMSRREAALILGVSPSANQSRIKVPYLKYTLLISRCYRR